MGTGAITGYFDVAQLVLYMFWMFFGVLVIYLTIESTREGFPIESDRPDGSVRREQGLLPMPRTKIYRTRYNGDYEAPHDRDLDEPPVAGAPIGPYPGMPLEPSGDPMKSAIGPGAWTQRADVTDKTWEGEPRIVPLRADPAFSVSHHDTDPRGLTVYGADGEPGGQVVEVWVDRSEHLIRYLEVKTTGGRTVLLPQNFARINNRALRGAWVSVQSILGGQFEGVPAIANQDVITLREEERVMAYFGGGTLFATPERREPLF